jgi:hypothetical protein
LFAQRCFSMISRRGFAGEDPAQTRARRCCGRLRGWRRAVDEFGLPRGDLVRSGEAVSQILQLREVGNGGGKLRLGVFLLRPVSSELFRVDALLLNADLIASDQFIKLFGKKPVGGWDGAYPQISYGSLCPWLLFGA